MYVVKTPWWLKLLYGRQLTWNISTKRKEVYLTFDDGPHPEITTFVLDQLKIYNAKATFFCIGKNVNQHPEVYRRIIDEGHKVGNHTYDHLNGWETNDQEYFDNIGKAKKIIDSNLFRPPYGRITRFQSKNLGALYNIVMWDVLSADFDVNISKEQCLANVLSNFQPGSIIVFHDSERAFPRLEFALPSVLQFLKENNYHATSIQ